MKSHLAFPFRRFPFALTFPFTLAFAPLRYHDEVGLGFLVGSECGDDGESHTEAPGVVVGVGRVLFRSGCAVAETRRR